MFFTQIYVYDKSNKNIYMLIYKKSLNKCLRLFHKTFSNCQATYQKELYLLFEKSGNFHRVSIEIGLTPSLPLSVFTRSLRTPLPPPQQTQGFPQVLRTWGGSSKFDGEGLSQYMGGAWGVKILLKNTCGGVHFIVKLLAISLQACKFTKNELLHSYFLKILARF